MSRKTTPRATRHRLRRAHPPAPVFRLFSRGLLLWAIFHCLAGAGFAAPPRLAIWCEFLPYSQVLAHLPVLKKHDCRLILHIEPKDVGRPDLAAVCRAARAQGVPLTAWLLLPYEEHLYVGEDSIAPTRDFCRRLLDWSNQEHLGLNAIVFDCEPSPLLGRRLFEKVRRVRPAGLVQIMRAESDPARFAANVAALNDLIAELHRSGVTVSGAANRVFLDFLHHGNTAVQDAMNAPFTMIAWDQASFITYRYRASQADYAAMINRYATLAHCYFGERAALDIGLIGDHRHIAENARRAELFGGGEFFMSYLDGMRSVYDLQEAVGIALGRGITQINLYSLDGAVDSVAGLDRWLQAAGEARPITGWAAWTPLRSLKMAALAAVLDGGYRLLVGAGGKAYAIKSPLPVE